MLTRSMTTAMSGRAAAARRLRRRASTAGRIYCATNGCTTYLIVDAETGVARCPVCQAVRRIS